jgi:hypothetical protein
MKIRMVLVAELTEEQSELLKDSAQKDALTLARWLAVQGSDHSDFAVSVIAIEEDLSKL